MKRATMGAHEAAKVMSLAGIPITYEKLRFALQQGSFSEFAILIDMRDAKTRRGNYEFLIFRKKLETYLRENCVDELSPAVVNMLYSGDYQYDISEGFEGKGT